MTSIITETIGNEYEGRRKWFGMVKGKDNCLYCLPHNAKQVLKIDPSNDKTALVGEEYDSNYKWRNGFAHGDFIYGIPFKANQFLKYNTKTETSELVGDDFDDRYDGKWMSGAVADDGCLYCFPYHHHRILKFNPNDDTTIFVGEEIEGFCKFSGTIKAKFKWMSGVEGMDDNIYGVPYYYDKWLKIDTTTETTSLVSDGLSKDIYYKYNDGVVGEDCNIYTILDYANKVVKFDTTTQEMSEVGNRYDGYSGWSGGVLHSNGYIYCAPHNNNKVLKIKTNHIRDEGNSLLESNASLNDFNMYLNSYQFEYIYDTHKAFYDRLVSYRNNLIVETAKLALDEMEARARETEGFFGASRSELDVLHGETKELRMELKAEKDRHKVKIEDVTTQLGEKEFTRKVKGPTEVTLSSSAVKHEPMVMNYSPILNNDSRKRKRNNV